ncbi:hypothetical protein N7504_012082 [Penicillium tannophilum]|nr:hypothetical protein N7504_012082 [Penicillium tannophilum]
MIDTSGTSSTYDHRVWRTGLPVRSAVLKPHAGRGMVSALAAILFGSCGPLHLSTLKPYILHLNVLHNPQSLTYASR